MTGTPTVGPTRGSHVIAAAVAGAGIGFLLVQGAQTFGIALPALNGIAWASIVALAALTAHSAWRTHRQVQKLREPVEPRRALSLVVWGRTSVLAGVGLGAGYLVVALLALPQAAAPSPAARLLHGLIAAVAGAAWAVSGGLLERACRIPPDDDSSDAPQR